MAIGHETATATQKKAYKTPSLTKYGQLKDLTTGGSGNRKEDGKPNSRP